MDYVILGSGPAGVTAAETLRQYDKNSRITMVGGEPEPAYSRMAIPYLIYGKINEQGTYLRQDGEHFNRLAITHVWGRAGGIDAERRKLFLGGGTVLPYDKLLIATGASPSSRAFPVPTYPACTPAGPCPTPARSEARRQGRARGARRRRLHRLDRARSAASARLRPDRRRGRPAHGRPHDGRDRGRHAHPLVPAARRQGLHRHQGGRHRAGERAHPLSVKLSTGSSVPAKLVVLAAGVRPNTGFLLARASTSTPASRSTNICRRPRPTSTPPATAARRPTSRLASPTCWRSSRSPSSTAASPR